LSEQPLTLGIDGRYGADGVIADTLCAGLVGGVVEKYLTLLL
jgi:hypothetical protein